MALVTNLSYDPAASSMTMMTIEKIVMMLLGLAWLCLAWLAHGWRIELERAWQQQQNSVTSFLLLGPSFRLGQSVVAQSALIKYHFSGQGRLYGVWVGALATRSVF